MIADHDLVKKSFGLMIADHDYFTIDSVKRNVLPSMF
jgi:hypothetical protein